MSQISTDKRENAKNLRTAERFFLHTSRSAFLFAVADDDVVREDCSAILRFSLLGKGKTIRIHDWERDGEELYPLEQLRRLTQKYPDTDGLILCGLDAALCHNPHFLEQLNFGREALSSFGIPILFWLGSDAMRKLNWEALDLFSQRAIGTLYFTAEGESRDDAAIVDKVNETDIDKPLQCALEARLQLLRHQLQKAEQREDDPAVRANDVVPELLRLYAQSPGNSRAVQLLLERYQHDFDEMTKATEGYQEALKIKSELDSAVTWLHISDLHLSDRGAYDQEVILRALVAAVKQFSDEGRVPDLIVVTGDIARSGKAEEYRQATLFFDDLLAAAGLEKRRLFVAPGNHDVDRKAGRFLLPTLDNDQDADEFFDPDGVAIRNQFQKLHAYSAWYNSYFAGIRSFPTDTTCSAVEVVQVRHSKVAILSLNSALFSIDDHDHGKLLLGRRCLDKAKIALQEQAADLNIALLHHPLDWLSAVERANIRATLGASVDLLLHGHYHETDTESVVSQHGGYLKLGAGAAYQTREWPNRAMYATAQNGKVTIFPICYQDKPREVWTLDTALFPSPSWIGTFPLPKRSNPDTREAVTVTSLDREYLQEYHEALRGELETINLLGTHALENVPVGLTDTFVALRLSDTWRSDGEGRYAHPPIPDEACPLPEQEHDELNDQIRKPEEVMSLVFEKKRLLLIIGDPGSGKTTLLKHYGLTSLDKREKLGFTEPLMVVFLPLRDLLLADGIYAPLSHNIVAWSKLHDLEMQEQHIAHWLKQRSTLLLFDGLDEISDPKQRIKACAWIDRIVARYTKARVVVTSRSTGYRKAEGIELASRHTRADIMDFSDDQQKEFLERWFTAALRDELKKGNGTEEQWEKSQKEKALRKAATILEFLGRKENRSLQLMARVPVLLQIMAILWKEREVLPATRVDLYEAALGYILDYRDRQRGIVPLLKARDALRVLAPVSLWMQETLKTDEVKQEAMQQQMEVKLKKLTTKRYSAEEFCQYLVNRAGLLVEYRDREYLFRHKSFREYMAGLQLLNECGAELRMATFAGYFGDDWWNEPLRFFIAQADAAKFDAFMRELFNSPVSAEMTQKQQDLLITLIQEAPEISFEALRSKLLHPDTSLNRQRYLLQCLNAIGQLEAHTEALEVVKQFNASGLSREPSVVAKIVKDSLGSEYLLIKGGTFTYSLTKKQETVQDLYVAKFTVTNKLFHEFISFLEAKEVNVARNLTLDLYKQQLSALAESINGFSGWLRKEKKLSKRFLSSYDDNKRFNGNDQPVIATWYAARAYCLWLSLLEGGKDGLYRLPKEMEWEFAAAGEEGRPYPWPTEKGEPTPKLANYNSNEGATTPVGRYPEGATPEGLCDMAGNVWEWTEDLYEKGEDWRSVRGGAYYSSKADALRCSSRSVNDPRNVNDYVGFRVIRSSHSSSS